MKNYERPEVKLIELNISDVIQTSTPTGGMTAGEGNLSVGNNSGTVFD